jgi:hypothetical protein
MYATLPDLKAHAQVVDNVDDAVLELALAAAQQQVEQWCRRSFDPPAEATRVYEPAGMVVRIDDAVTVDTVTVDGTTVEGWQVGPQTNPSSGWPYTRLALPWPAYRLVEVTGTFGWPSVPDAVVQATVLQAARLAQRRNAQFGVAPVPGMDGTGMRLLAKLDADVELLLQPFRRTPVLI